MANFVQIQRSYQAKSRWEDIAKQIAASNDGYLSVKDEIHFELKNGASAVVQVADLDVHIPNSVVFAFKDIPKRYVMNGEATNRGGWEACKMRKYMNGDFFALLPDDLQEVIKSRTIKQRLDGNIVTCEDKLWAMSHKEIFGADWQTDVDDVHLELFKDRRNRVKFFNGEPAYWWERSPYSNGTGFCRVDTNGTAHYNSAYYSFGVAPAFII